MSAAVAIVSSFFQMSQMEKQRVVIVAKGKLPVIAGDFGLLHGRFFCFSLIILGVIVRRPGLGVQSVFPNFGALRAQRDQNSSENQELHQSDEQFKASFVF